MWEYIEETRDKVVDLEKRVQQAKDNVEEIQKIMATWNTMPLFERKEPKHGCLLNFDDREERCHKRYAMSEVIQILIQKFIFYCTCNNIIIDVGKRRVTKGKFYHCSRLTDFMSFT